MRDINWDEVQEQQEGEFNRPAPGGYIARIVNVEDREDREDLKIEWDFAEGQYAGRNAEVFNRFGFWPITMYRSYSKKAEGYFKSFKTCVEVSNQNYTFRNNPSSLEGKLVGVVLGEEEYVSKQGEVKTKLYVYQVRSVKTIRDGSFKTPELKKLASRPASQSEFCAGNFTPLSDDGELPF